MDQASIKKITRSGIILILTSFLFYRFDSVKALLASLGGLISPFLIGALFAIFLNVPAKGINRTLRKTPLKKLSYKATSIISVILALLLIVFIFYIVFSSVIPQATRSLLKAFEELPQKVRDLTSWLGTMDFGPSQEELLNRFEGFFNEFSNDASSWIKDQGGDIISKTFNIVTNTLSFLVSLVLALIFSIYLLLYKTKLANQMTRFSYAFFNRNIASSLVNLARRMGKIIENFFGAVGKEAIIYGLMNYVAMKILSLPFASIIALLGALTTFIPYFGAFIGGLIGFLLILTVDIKGAFVFLLLTIFLQQFESNLIYPRVVGDELGLPGIWVMVAVAIGGKAFGIVGMVLAVPVVTMVYYSLGDLVETSLRKKKGEDILISQVIRKTNEDVFHQGEITGKESSNPLKEKGEESEEK